MKSQSLTRWIAAAVLAASLNVGAEDIDIFTNPQGPAGAANVLIMIDNSGKINAQMTNLDGSSDKSYTVAADVLAALLDPAELRITFAAATREALWPISKITKTSLNCTTDPVVTSGCECENYGYETTLDETVTTNCRLPTARVTEIQAKLRGARMGLMLFNGKAATGDSSKDSKGGYVSFAVQALGTPEDKPTDFSAAHQELIDKLGTVETANTSTYALGMEEAYLYFSRSEPNTGWIGSLAYNKSSTAGYDRLTCGLANTPPETTCTGNYQFPTVANTCRNAIVVIGPGEPASSTFEKDSTFLKTLCPQGTDTPYPIDIPNSKTDEDNMFDEWARCVAKKDFSSTLSGTQGINTYTIITEEPGKTNMDARRFMESGAVNGGGLAFVSQSGTEFLDAFLAVLDAVQSVNSEFASVALPVSVNVRGTNLNQVYVGMFRPDKDGKPRWFGNMKEYQLAFDGTDIYLADASTPPKRAETSDGQLIADDARSFWTSGSDYWGFAYPKAPSDNPDGKTVEKGAAAQKARLAFDNNTRNVYTCIGCGNTYPYTAKDLTADPAAFKDTNDLLINTTTGKLKDTALINWCRGVDNLEDENKDGSYTDVRASLYGDVLHSKPAVINYNTTTTCVTSRNDNDVYVFYGTNDGSLKATKGGDDTGGQEQWSYIAEEHLGKLDELRTNLATTKKPYFVDGSITSYTEYETVAPVSCSDSTVIQKIMPTTGNSKAWIFATMRRGGRFVYAMDVKDPATPKLKWKIDQNTPGFSKLGYTFSELKTTKILLNSTATPVVIFGGGYDPDVEDVPESSIASWDSTGVTLTGSPSITKTRTMGNGVYVVNADTGALIWRVSSEAATADCPSGATCVQAADMTYGIPTDIGVVDRDRNGYADRFYFGDTGGNVWRANIASAKPDGDSSTTPPTPAWNAYKLATFQTKIGSETDASRHRKFAYSPDVVAGPGDLYDIIMVGSGDREQPFDKTVVNRFYAIKDDNSIPGTPLTETSTGMYALQPGDLDPTNGSYTLTDVDAKGWFYTLTEPGEKIVSSPVTVNGISFFNTNIPRDDCSSGLGEARIYALEVLTGQAPVYSGTDGTTYSAYKTVPGGGFLPTGVPAIVEVGGATREVLLVGTRITQDIGVIQLNRRVRTFWYQGIDQ